MRKKKVTIGSVFRWAILLFFLVITIYPVIWMIFGSLKTTGDFYTNIWGIPDTFHISNYIEAWERGELGRKYLNSILVTGLFLLIIIPVNCCAAYVLARVRFKGRKLIYMFLLVGMMIPAGILGMPTYSVALKLGLVDSVWGIAFVYAGQAVSFGVFLMRSFYVSLPQSLEDAAMIDGCNRFQSFVKVVLPLTKPGIMIQVVFSGLNTWNEYFLSSIMLRSEEAKTLPVGIMTFVGEYSTDFPQMFAALTAATMPLIIIYLLAQKQFIEGLTAGATKG
ncbi:MAG TPA: carbohydrate ABC transporter permease [Candidatus Blautia avistercoris]|nr:carbohydrate ABC transporter permease [Candidatus Blautia avistercoris]